MPIIDAADIGLITEFRVLVALAALLLMPGYVFLSVSQFGQGWSRFCRFALAVGLSISFYPVLFYNLRFWFPSLVLNKWMLALLLMIFGFIIFCSHCITYRKRGNVFSWPSWLGIAAALVIGLTILTRLWIAHLFPIPAWADSAHHVLITQLTVQQGQLATSLEPYFPINLAMYHLGFYSLSSSVEWLSGAASHVSVQWTAQILNGLCGLGIYLVLEPRVGKVGAITGAAVAGLLSHQPAYYANWGRYTQIASQTILFVSWAVVLKGMESLISPAVLPQGQSRQGTFAAVFCAGLLSASVFLLHFRIAALYIALLVVSIPWYMLKAYHQKRLSIVILYLAAVASTALLFVFPTLWQTLTLYASLHTVRPVITDAGQVAQAAQSYFVFPWSSIPALSARYWLLILAGISALVGVVYRKEMTFFTLLWIVAMFGIGSAHVLDIALLKVTNLGTVLIMLYMPISILIGIAIGALDGTAGKLHAEKIRFRYMFQRCFVVLLLLAGCYGAWQRIHEIEDERYFVQEQDLAAMDWIDQNVPVDSMIAVNTMFWLPGTPHGIDAGYWVPYFTERKITAGPLLMVLASYEYRKKVIERSRAVVALEEISSTNDALKTLKEFEVEYIYIGALSRKVGKGISIDRLKDSGAVEEVYVNDGSIILRILDSRSLNE